MIKLEVEDYCHTCEGFEAHTTGPVVGLTVDGEYHIGDTVIRCAYRNRCKNIKRHLEKQIDNNMKEQ